MFVYFSAYTRNQTDISWQRLSQCYQDKKGMLIHFVAELQFDDKSFTEMEPRELNGLNPFSPGNL